MSKKAIIWSAVVAGFIAIGGGAFVVIKEQMRLLKSYCYRIKGFKINSIKVDDVNFDLSVAFRNQSNLSINIIGYKFDISVEGISAGTISSDKTQTLKPKAITDLTMNVKFSPKIALSNVLSLLNFTNKIISDKNNVQIMIDGYVSAKHSFIKVTKMPISMTMTIGEALSDDPNLEKCAI